MPLTGHSQKTNGKNKMEKGFKAKEIIFSTTSKCNLHCEHCYVSRNNNYLDSKKCKALIESALEYAEKNPDEENFILEKIGFTGGEPFLALDFVKDITAFAFEKGLMFDFLMTNGDWWKNEEELYDKLGELVENNFDGKIGLSFDVFHNQCPTRIEKFLSACYQTFKDNSCVEIFTVIPKDKELKRKDKQLSEDIRNIKKRLDKKFGDIYLNVRRFKQSFESKNISWNKKKWFKEDYCQATGNVFYVHTDGNIAPCCGFANENPELFCGSLENSWEELILNAQKNKFVNICFNQGLLSYKEQLEKEGLTLPGKTDDMCAFCDWCMKMK